VSCRTPPQAALHGQDSRPDHKLFPDVRSTSIISSLHENSLVATLVGAETYNTGGSGPASGTDLDIVLTDLAPLVTAYNDASDYFSLRSQTVNFVTYRVHSLETNSSAARVPTLVVGYVPEPTSLAMVGLALGVVLRRRR